MNLFKGEQQKNVDFALLQAIRTTGIDPDQGMMLIYDIACQYSIRLQERIGKKLPPGLEIDHAIGLFHVHAHKEACFFQYSTSFIPGAGITAGEILESLWSSLNSISPTVRTATLAHRAEILDDHASDSNHKKLLGMTKYLCHRYLDSAEHLTNMIQNYAEQSEAAGPLAVQSWTTQIAQAERHRLTNLKLMDIYGSKRVCDHAYSQSSASESSACQPEIHAWLMFAITVEEKQYSIYLCYPPFTDHLPLTTLDSPSDR